MLTEILGYLKNWFITDRFYGDFKITDGEIAYSDDKAIALADGQYFRVQGSIFNDGIYKYNSDILPQDEEFTGSIWALSIPQDLVDLSSEIEAWRDKYEGVDSSAMSPFNSESFGGYSYSKNAVGGADGGWEKVFRNRLARYRKV